MLTRNESKNLPASLLLILLLLLFRNSSGFDDKLIILFDECLQTRSGDKYDSRVADSSAAAVAANCNDDDDDNESNEDAGEDRIFLLNFIFVLFKAQFFKTRYNVNILN